MNAKNRYIIDVGAHDGKDSLYYLRRGFRVVAFEANPILAERVRDEAISNSLDIDVRNLAVADENGTKEFYVNHTNSTWSSLDKALGTRNGAYETVVVPTGRLDQQLGDLDGEIHYVKIDIEGFDDVALSQIMLLEQRPRFVSLENGSIRAIELLSQCGYGGFKFSNQKYVPHQKIPADTRYDLVDHQFAFGSSGLFGSDLGGRWLSAAEAKSVVNGLAGGRKAAPNNLWANIVGWFDLHAWYNADVK